MTIDTISLILKVIMLVLTFGLITYIFVLIIKDCLDTFRHSYLIVTQMQRKSGKVSTSNNNILSSKRIKNPNVLGSIIDVIKRDYNDEIDPIEKIIVLYIYRYGKERDTND